MAFWNCPRSPHLRRLEPLEERLTPDGTYFGGVSYYDLYWLIGPPVYPPPNQALFATGERYALSEGTTLAVAVRHGVLANDYDADGDTLAAQLGTLPANGDLSLRDDGSFTYTPRRGFAGTDSFTYFVLDGRGRRTHGSADGAAARGGARLGAGRSRPRRPRRRHPPDQLRGEKGREHGVAQRWHRVEGHGARTSGKRVCMLEHPLPRGVAQGGCGTGWRRASLALRKRLGGAKVRP